MRKRCAIGLRAKLAAQRLMELEHESGSILLIGNGIFNRLIAKQLKMQGYQGPKAPTLRHFGWSTYKKRAVRAET